jgi:hypothetical protein
MSQKVAVVTGSSSGMGYETSLILARNGGETNCRPIGEEPEPLPITTTPEPTYRCYPLMDVLPAGCEEEDNENFYTPAVKGECNTGFIYVPKTGKCTDRDVFHDFDELDPRCQNNIDQVCSYDGTIYPICDGVTVQECYDLEDNVICEINTNKII